VAFNARGTDYITRGQTKVVAALGDKEGPWAVGIERGGRGTDKYRITTPPPLTPAGVEWDEPVTTEFTKLAGKVPEQVQSLLALSELNFAGQFDRPFLLTETAGEVARVLGRLTNVSLIFAAAREASRRKGELSGDLKAARAELQRCLDEKPRFATLKDRLAALGRAEEAEHNHYALQQRWEKLDALQTRLAAAEVSLEAATEAMPVVPDLTKVEQLSARLATLTSLGKRMVLEAKSAADHDAYAQEQAKTADSLDQEIHSLLVAAGTCPLCGQAVTPAEV
jgi:hypothetical protein